jgi:hypothetical protein
VNENELLQALINFALKHGKPVNPNQLTGPKFFYLIEFKNHYSNMTNDFDILLNNVCQKNPNKLQKGPDNNIIIVTP